MDRNPGAGWRKFAYIIASFVGGVCVLFLAGFVSMLIAVFIALAPVEDPYDWVLKGEQIILDYPTELGNISELFTRYPALARIGDGSVTFPDETGHYRTIPLEVALGLGDNCAPEYVPRDLVLAEPRLREALFFLESVNLAASARWGQILIGLDTKTHSVFGGTLIGIRRLPDGPVYLRGRAAASMTPREWSPPSGEFRWMHIADDWYVVLECDG